MKSKKSNEKIYDVMHKINIDVLKRGDIIFTTSEQIISSVIKKATVSDISHVMLCVSYGSVIDATGDGVHAKNPERIFYPIHCPIYIFRYNNEISDEKLDKIVNYVRDKIGTRYSTKEAINAKIKIGKKISKKQFCSRLVAQAYESVGINLVIEPSLCTPDELKKSDLLISIENSSVTVFKDEVMSSIEDGNATDEMIKATNSLLNQVRTIFPFVESTNDIISTVIHHPYSDMEINKILVNSGYLDVLNEYEIKKYPWRYDLRKMQELYDYLTEHQSSNILQHYCQEVLKRDSDGAFDNWKISLIRTKQLLYSRPNLETLLSFDKLYENLIYHHNIRLKIAGYFCENVFYK